MEIQLNLFKRFQYELVYNYKSAHDTGLVLQGMLFAAQARIS